MLPTSAGVEPATSWSPVGRRIQLSHRGRPNVTSKLVTVYDIFQFEITRSVGKQFARNKRVSLAIQHTIQVQWSILKYTWDKTKEAY